MSWRAGAGWFSRSPFRNSASSRSLSVGEDPEEASKRAEAAAIFRRFDHNGDGQLCQKEIHHAMLALGVRVRAIATRCLRHQAKRRTVAHTRWCCVTRWGT